MAKPVKILVVEDNPAVLEMVRRGMEPCGEVITASDGGDAMLKVFDEKPDLIISDFQMPGMDGRQLFEKIRGREQSKNIPFLFMATRGDIEEKLRPYISDGVEDFIVKPFYLKDLVSRAKKITDRMLLEKMQQKATRPGVLEGRLDTMNVIDLLQSLEMGQKSCKLTLRSPEGKCELFFQNGQCNDAVFNDGAVVGDEAVFKVVQWVQGEFEIDFQGSSPHQRTTRSTQGLLMEALRLLDEASRDAVEG